MRVRTSRSQEHPEISPRLRAATRLRLAALGGFKPSQARPQEAPLVGAALVVVLPSVAAWAALDHQQAPLVGAALVALRVAALRGFGPSQARPQQAPIVGAALEHQVTHCWVPLVALRYAALAGFGPYQARPQQTPLVGAALVALARSGHQQALGWAALVT